jgi:hypothetical protein
MFPVDFPLYLFSLFLPFVFLFFLFFPILLFVYRNGSSAAARSGWEEGACDCSPPCLLGLADCCSDYLLECSIGTNTPSSFLLLRTSSSRYSHLYSNNFNLLIYLLLLRTLYPQFPHLLLSFLINCLYCCFSPSSSPLSRFY